MVDSQLTSFKHRWPVDITYQGDAGVYIYPLAQLWAFSLVRSQSQVHLGLLVFGHSNNLKAVSVDKFV